MADIPESTNPDMSWIDIAVLRGGAVIVDAAPGWLEYFDGDIHVEDVFQCEVNHPTVPGLYRWAGFSIGSWDEGDGCVATGGTFTRAAPHAPIAEGVTCVAKPLTDDERKAAVDKWIAPPAMDREAARKANMALLIGRSWMRHSSTCRTIVPVATDDGFRDDCSCGLADVFRGFDAALSTLSADAIRQEEGSLKAREEGYRAGYLHVLGLARAGVPTKDFERDVGAYLADFVGGRP